MKKILWLILAVIGLVGSFSYAATDSLLHGVATWYNVTMDFDNTTTSTVWVDINSWTGNACGTSYSGFLLTWHVNREWNGYVYFNEDDGDNTVNSCVAVVLSGWKFVLTWVAATDSWIWYTMKFNDIKLKFDFNKKAYYFFGTSTDSALWNVLHWWDVYVKWLNAIDWTGSKIVLGNYVANWTNGYINVFLKDKTGEPVKILPSINVEIVAASSSIKYYTYFDEDKHVKKTFSVDSDGMVKIPIYFLKAIENWQLKLKFTYNIPDVDGNTEHSVILKNIKVKNPISNISVSTPSVAIVWEQFTGDFNISYISKWKINFVSVTWSATTDADYNFNMMSSTDTNFIAKITPKNSNQTKSKIESTYKTTSYTVWFSNFPDKKVTYNENLTTSMLAYADKRVNYNKSFNWLTLNQEFTWWDTLNTLSFIPILKDKHGYTIPDVKFNLKIKDNWIANSYTGWDCNEIDDWYQTNCKALQFIVNSSKYSWNIDGVLGTSFTYKNNISTYPDVKIVSYKPIKDWNLKFEITNLENTSDDWNFTNSWNYISLPSYIGFIKNIVFKPFVQLRLQGLDDEANYVDINNDIYLKLNNISTNKILNLSYSLTWEITKPRSGVSFSEWKYLNWNNISLNANKWLNLLQTILFSLDYHFDDSIEFNYNHGYYTYSLENGIGNLRLKPWSFYFDLGWTYKIGWVFVNGIVNKTLKYSLSVKNTIWRKHIEVDFPTIYNLLRKKSFDLIKWVQSEIANIVNISDLEGWVKYYDCNGWNVIVDWWTYKWNNSIILKDCQLIIKWNILKNSKWDSLTFFLFDDDNINLNNSSYLTRKSNIYITENVSDIEAGLFTRWSIFTVNWSDISENNIYIPNRITKINDRQLYILGSLVSQNNVGWSFFVQWENKFTIWWNRKIYQTDGLWWKTNISDLRNIAQIFDIGFWRWFKYGGNNSIAPSWYSDHCNGWNNKEEWCKYPVYIQFDSSIKNNLLFK